MTSHRKAVMLSPKAQQAMVVAPRGIVLNRQFVAAVHAVYKGGGMQTQPPERLVDMVQAGLMRQRGQLVPWTRQAIEQALLHLADTNKIVIRDPDTALAAAS